MPLSTNFTYALKFSNTFDRCAKACADERAHKYGKTR